jgi:hypothetical protein
MSLCCFLLHGLFLNLNQDCLCLSFIQLYLCLSFILMYNAVKHFNVEVNYFLFKV